MTYRIKHTLVMFVCAAMAIFTACQEDDKFTYTPTESLEDLITEAQTLLDTTEEGTLVGMQQPGSKADLEATLVWVEYTKEHATSQAEIDDAAIKLAAQIEIYENAVVAMAIPYIKQDKDGTMILLSENAVPLLDDSFSVETSIYPVTLSKKDDASSVFSCVNSGPDRGFLIRYRTNGMIQINLGDGSSWTDLNSEEGVIEAGKWQNISYVKDGNDHKLYVDGTLVASGTVAIVIPTDSRLLIGNTFPWQARMPDALVKEFRFWSDVRTEAEVVEAKEAVMTGSEEGLEIYLPLTADLGDEFDDITGNYSASIVGSIEWMKDGIPPVIVLDYVAFDTEVATLEALKKSIIDGDLEGTEDGDFPVGTIVYVDQQIIAAAEFRAAATRQSDLDTEAATLAVTRKNVESALVADANGLYFDFEDDDAVGFRITPNYTPQADYTVEFEVNIESLVGSGTGELFNNGNYGLWYTRFEEGDSEEDIYKAGSLWNFTHEKDGKSWWDGPETKGLVIRPKTWQHVAVVHKHDIRETYIYVDGVLEGTATDLGSPENSGWGETWLGNGWGGKIWGSIREYRLWDLAQSPSQLGSDISGNEIGLRIYFPLTRVNGVKFFDKTTNFSGELKGIKWAEAAE